MAKTAKVTTVTPISASFDQAFPKLGTVKAKTTVQTRGKMYQTENGDIHFVVTRDMVKGAIQPTASGKFLVNLGFDPSQGPIEFGGVATWKGQEYPVTLIRGTGINIAMTCGRKA